jgi:hypothetical protein
LFFDKFLENYLSSLANKQDKPNALDKNAIIEYLKIERLVTDNQSLCRVVNIIELRKKLFLIIRNYVQR